MLIDTHCHLGDTAFDADRDAVLTRAAEAEVGHVVIIADSLNSTERGRALAREHGLSCTAGVHPHEASSWNAEVRESIARALDAPEMVAVGETGLDYHYDHSPRDAQRAAFEAQLRLAAERGKPVVVHARDADDDMAAFLTEWGTAVPALILHSFSSGARVFEAALDTGAYFGFSGMVTFKNWRLSECVRDCPPDRVLLETDAPYLAPVPHRGGRNEPAYVRHVAERVATLRGESFDELAERTTGNACRCFGPRLPHANHADAAIS